MNTITQFDNALTFGPTYAAQVAATLPDWQGGPYYDVDGVSPRNDCVTLTYVGSDPDLQGAKVEGYVDRYRQTPGTVLWSAHMHVKDGVAGSKYIKELLPYDQQQSWPGSRINVSLKKSPAQVAKELERRLLAHYLPCWRHAMQRIREQGIQRDADKVLAAELAQILGCEVWQRNGGHDAPTVSKGQAYGLRCEHGGAYLQHGFSMTPAQAREFCALVAKWQAEGNE